jgi:hypothetical protein
VDFSASEAGDCAGAGTGPVDDGTMPIMQDEEYFSALENLKFILGPIIAAILFFGGLFLFFSGFF